MNTGNNTEFILARCDHVAMNSDMITWKLSETRKYAVIDAYGRGAPHRELMAAADDKGLLAFVRKWGPLRDGPSGNDSMEWYRLQRDRLLATVKLIAAIEGDSSDLRGAAVRLNKLKDPVFGGPFDDHLRFYPGWEHVLQDPQGWLENAPITEVERFCVEYVDGFPFVCGPRFVVVGNGRRRTVRASLFLNNLHEALWWMVWQDLFRREPFRFCTNCGVPIPSEERKKHKFCDPACAKRWHDRKSWRVRHGKNQRYRKEH